MATSTAGLVSLQQQPSVARLAPDTDDEVFKNSADNFTALPEFIFIDTKQRQASPVSTIKSLGDLTKRFPKLDDQAGSACTRKVISRSVMERERVLLGIPLFLDSSDQTLLRQVGWTFDHQKGALSELATAWEGVKESLPKSTATPVSFAAARRQSAGNSDVRIDRRNTEPLPLRQQEPAYL